MALDWLIIGGGIHGVHIAARLIEDADVAPEKLRIVDPNRSLLDRWRARTAATGMTHLRSPAVHNLDVSPWALMDFAENHKHHTQDLFAPPYNRPSLQLFNQHCNELIEDLELEKIHIRARAVSCKATCSGVEVSLCNGTELSTANIVLALGSSEQPLWPKWAPAGDPRVSHIFESPSIELPTNEKSVLVVGGGISAGQVALRLMKEGRQVHLVARHKLREHQFDSDPGWLGPKYMDGFTKEMDHDQRRKLITSARNSGSMSPDVLRALKKAFSRRKVHWHEDAVTRVDTQDHTLAIHLKSGDELNVQRVLLATGFAPDRPGGALVEKLVRSASLPCAGCGYPIVDQTLRWHSGVYVSGPLAELTLGPSARNISGARRAADRLVAVARATQSSPIGIQPSSL